MPSKKNNARTKGRAATTAKLGNSERNTANAKSNAPAGTKQQNNPKANSMASAKTKHQSHQPSGGQTQHRNPAPANAWARRNPKVFAAPVAKPHSKASGTGSPPPWKSIFGSAWFWAPKCDPAELERELKTRGFRPASVESVVDSRSAYTLMFNDTDYQDKVLQMAKSRSKRRNTNALHHWFCKVTNIEFARQSFTGLPPLNKTSPASLQNAIINMLNQAIRDDTTEKLHQVEVYSGHDDSESFRQVFFIGNPKFRHRAKPGESPPQLYMEKAGGDRVLLYCSASGSGKTAELAASAYSRDAAFSIQLDVPKDISTPESGPVRRKQARISLKTAIRKLVDEDKGIRALFLEIAQMIKHHGTNENKVRIVVAIDEAGSRPNLVNEIIRHYESHGQDLAAFIMTGCNNPDESGNRLNEKEWKKTQKKSLRVVFSIAGTGLHGDMEGSLPNNFEQLQPIAQRKVEDVYKVLCREYPDSQNKCPPFEQLPEYPLLNDIVHHNSRMTSALVFQLATTNFSYGDPRHQVKVVTAVFVDFCKSNGLEPLWNLPHVRLQAAASAYAALLFQETITVYRHDTPHEIREKALTGAIHFQKFGTHNAKIRDLIGRYGLLTTRSFADLSMEEEQEGGGVEVYPFLMDPAMQRLCGWMIAGGEVMAHADEALGTTSFAYEALTVQFLSSVIAAATTVKAEDRKDLKSMLEDGTAMYASEVRDDGGTFKSLFVDKNIEDSWEGLDGWYPVAFPSEFAMKGMYLQKSPMDLSSDETEPQQQQQQQQQVQQQQPQGQQQQPQGQQQQNQSDWDDVKGWEVELNDCTPFININGLTKYTPPQKSDQETLNIDKEYLKGLWDLRHAINKTPTLEEPTKVFYPPIASVAEGNSNLADGYVSVVVAQKEEVSNKIVWKNLKLVTICIQAKDKSTDRKISNKDIRQNKNRVLHKLLHIPFGEDRVYCVASRPGSLVNRTMSQADADAAKMSTTTGAGDRAAAKALENKHDEMKAAFMRRVEQVIPNNMWGVGSKTRANLLARVAAGIDTDLIAIKEEARNAAITQAEADEAHLASYIAMPIGEIPASKVLADAGILRSEHGKTERFSIQLTYSLT